MPISDLLAFAALITKATCRISQTLAAKRRFCFVPSLFLHPTFALASTFVLAQNCMADESASLSSADPVAPAESVPNSSSQDSVAKENKTGPSNAKPYTEVYPIDAVVDRQENVWIVDLNGHAVWRVEEGSPKIHIQGSKLYRQPLNRPRCLAFFPTQPSDANKQASDELFVGDTSTREVYKIIDGHKPVPMVAGKIGVPIDLAFGQDGTLFIADLEQRAVWRLKNGESTPEVFLPNANARGVFVDSQDRLWVVSQNPQQLVRYDQEGTPTVLVATRTFEFPHQIVVDSRGVAWISDGYKKCIWKFTEGSPPEVAITSKLLQNPVGMLLYQDRPAVVDPHAMSVFKTNSDYQIEEWIRLKSVD